jgi:hypothetical protein
MTQPTAVTRPPTRHRPRSRRSRRRSTRRRSRPLVSHGSRQCYRVAASTSARRQPLSTRPNALTSTLGTPSARHSADTLSAVASYQRSGNRVARRAASTCQCRPVSAPTAASTSARTSRPGVSSSMEPRPPGATAGHHAHPDAETAADGGLSQPPQDHERSRLELSLRDLRPCSCRVEVAQVGGIEAQGHSWSDCDALY